MRILLTNQLLDARAGSESYLQTVAAELARLEHELVLYAPRLGAVAESLRATGLAVHDRVEDLPEVDVIHGQHTTALALVRERFPETPLVFVTHSWFLDIEQPLGLLRPDLVVAMSDLAQRRVLARGGIDPATVRRLRYPVDVSFADGLRTPPAEQPRLAVAVSRTLGVQAATLYEACEHRGLAFHTVGAPGQESADARLPMGAADIVFAIGRTALEAMALGRAVYVVDETTVGGWVTPESYADLEARGFTGFDREPGGVDLDEALAAYTPRLGADARRLAVEHHAVQFHAARLVELYREAGAAQRPATTVTRGLRDLQVAAHELETRAVSAQWEAATHYREVILVRRERDGLRRDWDAAAADAAAAGEREAHLEREVARLTEDTRILTAEIVKRDAEITRLRGVVARVRAKLRRARGEDDPPDQPGT